MPLSLRVFGATGPTKAAAGCLVAGILLMWDGYLRRRLFRDVRPNPRFRISDASNRLRGRYEPIVGVALAAVAIVVWAFSAVTGV